MSAATRLAATRQHQLAIEAINTMFDRADDLGAARDRLAGISPLGPDDDLIRDVDDILTTAAQLSDALRMLREAACAASAHRPRRDLAADLGTKVSSLFPRGHDSSAEVRPLASTGPVTQRPDDRSDAATA